MRKSLLLLLTLCVLMGLSACGQKGPLYLPGENGEKPEKTS